MCIILSHRRLCKTFGQCVDIPECRLYYWLSWSQYWLICYKRLKHDKSHVKYLSSLSFFSRILIENSIEPSRFNNIMVNGKCCWFFVFVFVFVVVVVFEACFRWFKLIEHKNNIIKTCTNILPDFRHMTIDWYKVNLCRHNRTHYDKVKMHHPLVYDYWFL